MLHYQLFPRSFGITKEVEEVIKCFDLNYDKIKSPENNLNSDGVLKSISNELKILNFKVEVSKAKDDKIKVPVLFSLNNKIDKFFDADAVSADGKIVTAGGQDSVLRVWNATDGKVLTSFPPPKRAVTKN